ncbi:hypothetical protein EON66_10860, partial [archaeon]
MQSKAQRQTYLEQCDAIMATVESTLAKQVSMLDGRKSVRDMKAVELQRLVETQRAYYKVRRRLRANARRAPMHAVVPSIHDALCLLPRCACAGCERVPRS